jgi:hypothetical protein
MIFNLKEGVMKREYFLYFGFNKSDVNELEKCLSKELGLSFEKRVSDYVGEYIKTDEYYSDVFRVVKNFNPLSNDWKLPDFKESDIIIEIAFINGKNRDKESMFKSTKNLFFKKFENIYFLKEIIIEDDNLNNIKVTNNAKYNSKEYMIRLNIAKKMSSNGISYEVIKKCTGINLKITP